MHRDHIIMIAAFDNLVEIPQTENMRLPGVAGRISEVLEHFQTAEGPEND